jgi:two-component system, NtrC family, response regulator HydG
MTHRALIVDDDKLMARTLAEILQLHGWSVEQAYSGRQAIASTEREHFDVVLMDIKMPGVDGVDAFKAMKAARPGIRVILMTAYVKEDRIREAERAGVIRVLQKPVNIPALLTLIAGSIDRNRPVLLIDYDAVFLRTMSDVLRERGFEVAVADDLDHATQLLGRERPLAVLLHVHLDHISVREAALTIHDANPAAALILYSGRPGTAEEIEQLPSEWIHAYLQKPFAIDQVTGVLDAIRGRG